MIAVSLAGGERAAALYTVIEAAKANGIELQAYIADVLTSSLPAGPPLGGTRSCHGTGAHQPRRSPTPPVRGKLATTNQPTRQSIGRLPTIVYHLP